MKTLYDLLGVAPQATHLDIEHGYRRHLSRHLLGNAGRPLRKKDQLRLQAMRNAYLVLSSPSRRQAYDRILAHQKQRRNRLFDIGGAILAVTSLVAGLAIIAISSPGIPLLEEPEPAAAPQNRHSTVSSTFTPSVLTVAR
ncbi:J domain-containing protein [Noviherbaspirillum saxi]|uniref:J domain-containing protein n=1 Tax=Noviherbaspirillum saxi TaxID=2320863 RepID=A0A3A3FMQ8_9BURK|nr:J domain-containing protein [Noviherbaspirillum saxi]RJF97183.1 J domain-containing protein [Noviherbaspirillum saxi]